jgi:hypothetical protein
VFNGKTPKKLRLLSLLETVWCFVRVAEAMQYYSSGHAGTMGNLREASRRTSLCSIAKYRSS